MLQLSFHLYMLFLTNYGTLVLEVKLTIEMRLKARILQIVLDFWSYLYGFLLEVAFVEVE